MAHIVSTPVLSSGKPVHLRLLASAGRLWRAWRNRRSVETLLYADDRMLADIGVTRSDVLGALSAPLHDDPSTILVRARHDRRRHRARSF